MNERVRGFCPMGCGETLFVAEGGYITCSFVACTNPTAVADILEDRETQHVVELHDASWSVKHPLRERLDDAIVECELGEYLAALDGPPRAPGRYHAVLVDDR